MEMLTLLQHRSEVGDFHLFTVEREVMTMALGGHTLVYPKE